MTSAAISRRDVLKGAAAVGAGVALGRPAPARARARRERVAIIGAGAGGIAAAYFLSGDLSVEVFEARDRIGGHCDSRTIDYRGRRVTVDLGAQFFHPDTHPIYVTLLEELGLYDPAHPDADATIEAPGSLCIFPAGGAPVFTSTDALATPERAVEFAQFTQLARNAVLSGLAWETTLEAWIASLPLTAAFKAEVLSPWLTALIGCSRAAARETSARAILQTFALSFPADIVRGATTYNSRIGLQGNLERLLARAPSARVHLRAPVRALQRTPDGWFLQTPGGRRGPYRHVLLNAPPRIGRRLLRPLRGFGEICERLDAYTYFDSRILIHTDPTYVQRDRANWAAYNAEVDGVECEGSAWLGALLGQPIDVFKSWAQRRRADPRHVVLQRRFKHPLITRPAIEAARELRPLQGHGGLYFSGQYTTGTDLQESAVWSAMQVAQALAPSSRTLHALEDRLAAAGLAGLSYAP